MSGPIILSPGLVLCLTVSPFLTPPNEGASFYSPCLRRQLHTFFAMALDRSGTGCNDVACIAEATCEIDDRGDPVCVCDNDDYRVYSHACIPKDDNNMEPRVAKCKPGYFNGGKEGECVDMNECSGYGGLIVDCRPPYYCMNTPGSFKCGKPDVIALEEDEGHIDRGVCADVMCIAEAECVEGEDKSAKCVCGPLFKYEEGRCVVRGRDDPVGVFEQFAPVSGNDDGNSSSSDTWTAVGATAGAMLVLGVLVVVGLKKKMGVGASWEGV